MPRDIRVMYAGVIGMLTLAIVAGIGLLLRAFETPRNGYASTLPTAAQFASNDLLSAMNLFSGWERPEVVLVLSGEQHGYLQPCGCTSPQYGGLTRRYNLIQALRQRGWPIVAADLGDMNQLSGPQALLKYEYAMKAHNLMGYTAVNVGEYESNMPLTVALAQYALNNPSPCVVNANLLHRDPGEVFNGTVFNGVVADKPSLPKVGVFGLTGSSVEHRIRARDPMVKFSDKSGEIIVDVLRKLKSQKAELTVLLYQGNKKEAAVWAKHCAKATSDNPSQVAPLNVILCVSSACEPPSVPTMEGNTMIIEVGQKGRFVGVVGAFRQPGPTQFGLQYQLVSIEPKLDTPKGEEKGHKLMALLEEYAAELRNDDYLAKYKQVANQVQLTQKGKDAYYVGSAECKKCHDEAYKIWEKSKHSHAYQSLVNAKNPSLRQFDGECVVCHTVGFGYKTGFENFNKTPNLIDVGCESCHGPSSEHVRKPRDPEIHLAINPNKFRGKGIEQPADKHKRFLAIDSYCQKCHDQDNDIRYDFDKDWPKIIHMNPSAK